MSTSGAPGGHAVGLGLGATTGTSAPHCPQGTALAPSAWNCPDGARGSVLHDAHTGAP